MEVLRPAVDAYVLEVIEGHVFTRRDFIETRRGQVRILPPLTHYLASTASTWARLVAPHAEMIAQTIASSAGLRHQPTLLTGSRRRAARPTPASTAQPRLAPTPPPNCIDCGTEMLVGRRRCTACHAEANASRMRGAQAATTEHRRATGLHPMDDPSVRGKIALTQREQWAKRHAVENQPVSGYTDFDYRHTILPKLAGLPVRTIVEVTGLSKPYAGKIRSGGVVPHRRHWPALQLAALRAQDP